MNVKKLWALVDRESGEVADYRYYHNRDKIAVFKTREEARKIKRRRFSDKDMKIIKLTWDLA